VRKTRNNEEGREAEERRGEGRDQRREASIRRLQKGNQLEEGVCMCMCVCA
jgi:hypothetical protein